MQCLSNGKNYLGVTILLSASMLLGACGGGGGGSTTNNTQMSMGNGSNGATTTNPAGPTPPATQGLTVENFLEVAAVAFVNSTVFVSSVEEAFASFSEIPGPLMVTTPAFCESGAGEMTLNFAAATRVAGDTVVQTFDNCVVSFEDSSQTRDNGQIFSEILEASGSLSAGGAFDFVFRFAYTNFTTEEIAGTDQGQFNTLNGDLAVDTSNDGVIETTTITGQNDFSISSVFDTFNAVFILTETIQVQDLSNNTIVFTSDFGFQLITAITNGSFVTDTTQPFMSLSTPGLTEDDGAPILRPTSGFQVTTDGNGASVGLTALTETTAEVSLDLNGDNVAEATQLVTYAQLEDIVDAFFL